MNDKELEMRLFKINNMLEELLEAQGIQVDESGIKIIRLSKEAVLRKDAMY